MDSTNGPGISHAHHHGPGGRGWGWGFGRGIGHRDGAGTGVRLRTATETSLATVADASDPDTVPGTGESSPAQTDTSSLRYERQEKTALVIRTQEGDLVRLRFAEREALEFDEISVATGDTAASESTLSLRTAARLSVRIQGDLNEDELGAIRSVIEQAASLAAEFFDGDAAEAFALASELAIDGQQLAGVTLRMRVREALTYDGSRTQIGSPAASLSPAAPIVHAGDNPDAAATAAASVAAGDAAAADTPTADAGAAVETADATAPVAAQASQSDAAEADEAPETDEAPTGEAPAAADGTSAQPATIDPFIALRSMIDFLTHLIETFDTDAAGEPDGTAAADDAGERVAQGEEAAQADEPVASTQADTSVSFSLKLRVFSSLIASVAAVGESGDSEPDPAGEDGGAQGTGDAAVTTLTDAVDAIAAASEPGYEGIA